MSAPGRDGAVVEVCRARACAPRDVEQTIVAGGDRVVVPSELAPGVHYWRLRGRVGDGGGARASAVWQLVVGVRSAARDGSWGTVFDANNDGYADVAVGAYGANRAVGRAYVFLGGASGLGATPAVTLDGDRAGGRFGGEVANVGDVNGDGFADLAVGASSANRVVLYLGGPAGPSPTPSARIAGPAGAVNFGHAIASAGDVDGDGYADFVVGAPSTDRATGRVFVYHGGPSGSDVAAVRVLESPEGVGAEFGNRVGAAGDLNADGYADVAVGAPNAQPFGGRAHVYLGSASGLSPTPVASLAADGGAFGLAIDGASDVNGDGYADLVVGAPYAGGDVGRAHLYLGGAAGVGATPAAVLAAPDGAGSYFAASIAAAGDVDRDGYSDILVGAAGSAGGVGRAYLYRGGAGGLRAAAPMRLNAPLEVGDRFGYDVAGAGDVNGDGHADVVVGACGANHFAGRAQIFLGAVSGLGAAPATSLEGLDGPGGGMGSSVQ
jgi:hypothetical protein